MLYNKTKKIILFGGGRELFKLAVMALKLKFDVVIFTQDTYLSQQINSCGSLRKNLKAKGMPYIKRKNITKNLLKRYINASTIGFSASAPWIFKQDIINLFKGNFYNFHTTRLPLDRGRGGYTWNVLSQSRLGGLTIHKVAESIDMGNIIMQDKFDFPKNCRIPLDYHNCLDKKEDKILWRFINRVKKGHNFIAMPQDKSISTYWPAINSQVNGFINWMWNSEQIRLFINAFDDPYIGASSFIKNQKVHLKGCLKHKCDCKFHPYQAGIVYRMFSDSVYIAGIGGGLRVQSITDNNGQNFKNRIKIGDRFYTPYSYLEDAMMKRCIYTADKPKYV